MDECKPLIMPAAPSPSVRLFTWAPSHRVHLLLYPTSPPPPHALRPILQPLLRPPSDPPPQDTPMWRKGWVPAGGAAAVNLCNACGIL